VRAAALALIVMTACGSKTPPTRPTETPPIDATTEGSGSGSAAAATPEAKVGVALQVEPAEANVTIDDLVVGTASQLDPVFALAPGLHTLVITHPGYKTYRMEFSVTDKTESFTIHLDPKK
jgi:hypothetical protein